MVDVGNLAQSFRDIDPDDWSNLLYILLVILLPALGKLGAWLRERSANVGEKAADEPKTGSPAKASPTTARAAPPVAMPSVPPVINRADPRPGGAAAPTDDPRRRGPITVRVQRGDRPAEAIGDLPPPAKGRSRPTPDRRAPRPAKAERPAIPIPDAVPVRTGVRSSAPATRPVARVQASSELERRLPDWHLSPGGKPSRQAADGLRSDQSRSTPVPGVAPHPGDWRARDVSPALRRLLQRRDFGAVILLNELLRPPLALREQGDRPY